MNTVQLVPSCDPVTALRRIAARARGMLPLIRQELADAHQLGPSTARAIWRDVRNVQRGRKALTIGHDEVEELLEIARGRPRGCAVATGGHPASFHSPHAQSTVITLWWATVRGRKLCRWRCTRVRLEAHTHGTSPQVYDEQHLPGNLIEAEVLPFTGPILEQVRTAVLALRLGLAFPGPAIGEEPVPSIAWKTGSCERLRAMLILPVHRTCHSLSGRPDTRRFFRAYLATPLFAAEVPGDWESRPLEEVISLTLAEVSGFIVSPEHAVRLGPDLWKTVGEKLPDIASSLLSQIA
jgi:hypothetical protein